MIYKWANVIIHEEFLSRVPADIDHSDFFTSVTNECELIFNLGEESKVEIHGSWQNIIKAERLLQEYCNKWENVNKCLSVVPSKVVAHSNIPISQEVIVIDEQSTDFNDEISHFIGQEIYVVDYKANDSGTNCIQKVKEVPKINKMDDADRKKPHENDKVEELYLNITVKPPINWEERRKENPLDKLCQLLQIDEEDDKEKRLQEVNKKQKYEENLPYKYFCSLCSFKSKRESHYTKHIQLHNKHEKILMCTQCDFKTIRLSTLRKHELTHQIDQLFRCKVCSYKTDDSKLFLKHQQSNHVHKCNYCDFIGHSVKEARKHFYVAHKPDKPLCLWKCDKCPYKSRLKAHLQRHNNDVHGTARPFLCQYCGKCFKRHDTLKQHKVMHGEVNPSHVCAQCSKVCCSASQLKEHMSVHTLSRPFLCEHCGASFKTKSIQRNHIKTLHSVQAQYQCDTCNRSFRGKANLMRHMKTHRSKPNAEILQLEIPEIAICEPANQDNIPVVLEINNTPLKIEVLYSDIGNLLPKQDEL